MKKLTEEDVKFRFVDPAIENIGWNKNQINKEYYFTDGQIKVSGKKLEYQKRIFDKLKNFFKIDVLNSIV